MSDVKPASEKQIKFIETLTSKLVTNGSNFKAELVRRIEIRENLNTKEASIVIGVLSEQFPDRIFTVLYNNKEYAPLFGQRVVDFLKRLNELREKGLTYSSDANLIIAIDNPQLEQQVVATPAEIEKAQALQEAQRREREAEMKRKAERDEKYRQAKEAKKAEDKALQEYAKNIKKATQGMRKVNADYVLGQELFSYKDAIVAYRAVVAGKFQGIIVRYSGGKVIVYAPTESGLPKVDFS